MGHSHKQHWESGPRGTTNQSIPGHVDRKLAPVGWQLCPLLSVYVSILFDNGNDVNFITITDHITVTRSTCDPTMETTGPNSLYPTSSTKPPGVHPTSSTDVPTKSCDINSNPTTSIDSSGKKCLLHVILHTQNHY